MKGEQSNTALCLKNTTTFIHELYKIRYIIQYIQNLNIKISKEIIKHLSFYKNLHLVIK